MNVYGLEKDVRRYVLFKKKIICCTPGLVPITLTVPVMVPFAVNVAPSDGLVIHTVAV